MGNKAQDFGEWYKNNNTQNDESQQYDPARNLAYETARKTQMQQTDGTGNVFKRGEGLGTGRAGDIRGIRTFGTQYAAPSSVNINPNGFHGNEGYFGAWTPDAAYNYANKMVDDGYWTYNKALEFLEQEMYGTNTQKRVSDYYPAESNGTNHGGGRRLGWTNDDLINYLSDQINSGYMTIDDAKAWIDKYYRNR